MKTFNHSAHTSARGGQDMARLDASAQEISAPAPAFLTDDCAEILQFAADCFDSGQGSALVTLVGITGGAARSIGAQMAVRGDARYCGYVSGGCTEAAIATEAAEAIVGGYDRLLRLGDGSPFFDITLPCGGGITLAIHVIRDSMVLRTTLLRLARRKTCWPGVRSGGRNLDRRFLRLLRLARWCFHQIVSSQDTALAIRRGDRTRYRVEARDRIRFRTVCGKHRHTLFRGSRQH